MASIVRYEPFRVSLGGMARDFDRMFDRVFEEVPGFAARGARARAVQRRARLRRLRRAGRVGAPPGRMTTEAFGGISAEAVRLPAHAPPRGSVS